MTQESIRKLQEQLSKEAVAVLADQGPDARTNEFEDGIVLAGEAGGVPRAETLEHLAAIVLERRLLKGAANASAAAHAFSEEELNHKLTALETMEYVWDIFEASTMISGPNNRTALFNLAFEFADIHGLRELLEALDSGTSDQ